MTTATPLARYSAVVGALASSFATAQLHHSVGHDRPFGGPAPSAALFHASRDRSGDHPERHLKQFTGILQADAYAGYNGLYHPDRKPAP